MKTFIKVTLDDPDLPVTRRPVHYASLVDDEGAPEPVPEDVMRMKVVECYGYAKQRLDAERARHLAVSGDGVKE